MTELMKRYEAETGKKATTYPVALLGSRDSDGLNVQVGTPEYIVWFEGVYQKLKEQLRWRPVSEKPEKGQYFLACVADDETEPKVMSFWGACDWDSFVYVHDIVKWLPIPPAPEVKEIPIAGTVKVRITNKKKQMAWDETPAPEGE